MQPTTVKGKGREPDPAKLDLYWSLLRSHAARCFIPITTIFITTRFDIEDDEKSQIISFLNNECNSLNQFGCFVYNRHLVWSNERRMRKQFHVGDKIICTKNADVPVYVHEARGEGEQAARDELRVTIATDGKHEEPEDLNLRSKNERLMNGNLYKLRAVCRASVARGGEEGEGEGGGGGGEGAKESKEYWVLDDLAGEVVRASPDVLQKKTKIAHAWALSIHKFQGSEADTIVYGLSGSGYESWRHVYTAVTRGKRRVVVVGTWAMLERAVKKKPGRRQTALQERVRRMVAEVLSQEKEKENTPPGVQEGSEEVPAAPATPRRHRSSKEAEEEAEAPVTPSKLSQMFEDSMRDWGSQEEVLETVFKPDSPGKRCAPQAPRVSALAKRSAADSPASYQAALAAASPATYGVNRSKDINIS